MYLPQHALGYCAQRQNAHRHKEDISVSACQTQTAYMFASSLPSFSCIIHFNTFILIISISTRHHNSIGRRALTANSTQYYMSWYCDCRQVCNTVLPTLTCGTTCKWILASLLHSSWTALRTFCVSSTHWAAKWSIAAAKHKTYQLMHDVHHATCECLRACKCSICHQKLNALASNCETTY